MANPADFAASSGELKATIRYFEQIQRASDRFGQTRYQNLTKLNSELKFTSRYFDQVYKAARRLQSVNYDVGIQNLKRQVIATSKEFSSLYLVTSRLSRLQIGIQIGLTDNLTSKLDSITEKIKQFNNLTLSAAGTVKVQMGEKQVSDSEENPGLNKNLSALATVVEANTQAIRSNTAQILMSQPSSAAESTAESEEPKSIGSKIMGVLGGLYTILALVDFSYRGSAKMRQMNQQKKFYPDANAGGGKKGGGTSNKTSSNGGLNRPNRGRSGSVKLQTPEKVSPKAPPAPKPFSDKLKTYNDRHGPIKTGDPKVPSAPKPFSNKLESYNARYGPIKTGEPKTSGNVPLKADKKIGSKAMNNPFKTVTNAEKSITDNLPKKSFMSSIGEKFKAFKNTEKNFVEKIPGQKLLKTGGKFLGKAFVPLAVASGVASIFQAPKEERGKAIGSVVGTAAGAFFGGPAGAMVGSYLGGKAGELIQQTKVFEKGGKAISDGVNWVGKRFKSFFGKKSVEESTAPSTVAMAPSLSSTTSPAITQPKYPQMQAATVGAAMASSGLNTSAVYQANLASKIAVPGNNGTKAGTEAVQLSETQLGAISGMLKDFKTEVTNQVSITIPQGAVQLDIHEEIDYAEIEGKIGAAIVAKVRQAFNNYKPSGGGSGGPAQAMAT
ncbi:DUF456 domain-containing protein [Saccharibacillus sp. CPCC 101409]|uniref:DUF456 domain-containing protein n=1 Tax=Saccharibacillus sp. CPCC 101409 TaxID=3058041 RepID=UPI002671B28D|nr:DUF456 domain-containing protein [Saccharibacillus sp. CPCC 101409]MDO3408551.1 DUF456 domain-containing protein [Saccharibacillus sp. CPCC 101409]